MDNGSLQINSCVEPSLNDLVGWYCFGDLPDKHRSAFEEHLLHCDACWGEVQRLEASVRVLRTDRQLVRTVLSPDALPLFGLSGRLQEAFGGHLRHVLVSGTLYALWYPLALLSEIAYEIDQFERLAFLAAPGLFLWIAVTSTAAMAVDWRRTTKGYQASAAIPIWLLALAAVAPILVLGSWLPSLPIVQLEIQAYSAQAGYLKTSVLYGLPLALIFLLAPFHAVISLQRELEAGRHRMVLALLRGDPAALAPRGVLFLRSQTLWLLLGVATVLGAAMTAHLVDNLQPGRYMNFFILLLEARIVLWFSAATVCVVWYQRCLNELKRECLATMAVPPDSAPTEH